jgi:hypothetical protein
VALPWQDRDTLAGLLDEYRTNRGVAAALQAEGYTIAPGTVGLWRRRLDLPIPSAAYRLREERRAAAPPQPGAAARPTPAEEPEEDHEAVLALLEYLKGRKVPAGVPSSSRASRGGYARALIGGDLHFPHHHDGGLEVFLGLAEIVDPAEVVLNGDTFDFAQLGHFPRNPAAYVPIQNDLDRCREEVLARVAHAAPAANLRLVMGNHELDRWNRYLWTRAPELASLRCLDLEAVLGLTELGWLYEPDGLWLTPELVVDHGDRHTNSLGGGSAQSARKEMLDVGSSGVTGHTHHGGVFYRRDARGFRVWAEGFSLIDPRKARRAGVTARKRGAKVEDWHLGAIVVEYEPNGSAFFLHPLPFLEADGRTYTVWNGEEVSA